MKFTLAGVPLALLAISGYLANARGPYSLSQNFDPEYGYLLSSLSILRLHVPTFTDNPGTTVEEIGAGVSGGKWIAARIAGGGESISRAILAHPEDYLRAIHFALAVIVAGSVFWAGWTMFHLSGSLTAGLVLQLSVFLFRETIIAMARVSPEPLLIAASFLMGSMLLPAILPAREGVASIPDVEARSARWAGVLWGLGVATKFTSIPLGAMVGIFGTWKARRRFVLTGIAAGLLFTMPIWPILDRPAQWLYGTLIHKGYYGQGERGLPAVSQMLSNLRALVHDEPSLFGLGLFYLVFLAIVSAMKPATDDRLAPAVKRLLWSGLACIAIQLAATVKHYRPHYMIPAFGVMALINGCVALLLFSPAWNTRVRAVLTPAVAFLSAAGIVHAAWNADQWGQRGAFQERDAAELAQVAAGMPECVVIGYYRSSATGFGVEWGSEYAAGASADTMKEVFPDTIFYNRFQHRFRSSALEPRFGEVRQMLRQGRCVLMQGTPVTEDPLTLPPGFSITPVAENGKIIERPNEALYRLAWTPSAP